MTWAYEVCLDYKRLSMLWACLSPKRAEDTSIAFILGTGIYPRNQWMITKNSLGMGGITSHTGAKRLRLLPELENFLLDRFEFLDGIAHRFLLSMGHRGKKGEVRATEAQISYRLKEIYSAFGWSMKDPFWRLHLTAMLRMVQEKWGTEQIITQLGKKKGNMAWITESKLERFWVGTPEAERESRLQALGKEYVMEPLKYLTDDQLCQIYQTCLRLEQSVGWRKPCFFVRLLLGSGLRISEAIKLKTQDILVQFDPPVIYVRKGKGAKTRHSQVIPEFAGHLKTYVKEMPDFVNPFLFPSVNWNKRLKVEAKTHVGISAAYEWWLKVMEQAGIKSNPHMARHTFATWEAERLSQFALKDTLGHSSITTTEKFYRHGIIGRNYTTEAPKWRDIAGLVAKRDETYKDVKKSRFMRRSAMVHIPQLRRSHDGKRAREGASSAVL